MSEKVSKDGGSDIVARAKAVKLSNRTSIVSPDSVELALAWVKDEVRLGQLQAVLGYKPHESGAAYLRLAIALREAYRQGRLKEVGV